MKSIHNTDGVDEMLVFEIKDNILVKYHGTEKEIIIPDNIKEIGDRAFSGCEELKTMKLPGTVKKIGKTAFAGCRNLERINIGDCGIDYIGEYAFSSCNSLKEIIIPDSVKYIGTGAFSGCSQIKSIIIPEGIDELEILIFL